MAVLVLGGGLTQCDAIESALAMGLEVVVADANPDAPGMRSGEPRVRTLPVSFTSVEEVLAQLRERGIAVDAVLPYGSDLSVLPAAAIASRLGLRTIGEETARACTDKVEMRRRWMRAGLPVLPHAVSTEPAEAARAAESLGLPVVVKPPDNAAQRGVQRVDDPAHLEAAAAEALRCSPSRRILVERYVEGPEVAVTTFAVRGATSAIQVTDRVTGPPPYLGICLAHVYPSALPSEDLARVEQTVVRAAEALGVTDGPTYSQVRVSDGTPYVLETGARLGGGRDSELRLHLSGQDAIRSHIELLRGGEVDLRGDLDPRGLRGAGCVQFLVAPPGRIVEVLGWDEVRSWPAIRSMGLFFGRGQTVPELRSGAARAGYLIATAETRQSAVEQAARAARALRFVVE